MQLRLRRLLLLLVVPFPIIHARRISITGTAGKNQLINHVKGRRGRSGWDYHCCCKLAACSVEERMTKALEQPEYLQNVRSNGDLICCSVTWTYIGQCPVTTPFKTLASSLLRSTKEGCKAPSCQGNYGVKPTPSRIIGSIEPCECEVGFRGPAEYDWSSNSWSTCQLVPCPEDSHNHPACECRMGYQGGYQGKLTWSDKDKNWEGKCVMKKCPPNSMSWPFCKCNTGFKGSLVWKNSDYVGECEPEQCPDNAFGFPTCQCLEGFQGDLKWAHQQIIGNCKKVECPGHSSGHPKCQCNKFFSGKLVWNGAGYNGECFKAKCPRNSGSTEHWPTCGCNEGYAGKVVWSNKKQRFRTKSSCKDCPDLGCMKVPCPENALYHPKCQCRPGFVGDISWISEIGQYLSRCAKVACPKHSQSHPNCRCTSSYKSHTPIKWNGKAYDGKCESAA